MASRASELQFLRQFLVRPLDVASPVPSGRTLARRIAALIDPEPGGLVVELGPGTGSVTSAIRERGVADSDLLVIESDPGFVALLRRDLPGICVVEGDAFAFADILGAQAKNLRSIVCGLPVVGKPRARRSKLLSDGIAALRPGAPFIQFSYSVTPPLPATGGAEARRVATVWRNIPPMQLWVYRGR